MEDQPGNDTIPNFPDKEIKTTQKPINWIEIRRRQEEIEKELIKQQRNPKGLAKLVEERKREMGEQRRKQRMERLQRNRELEDHPINNPLINPQQQENDESGPQLSHPSRVAIRSISENILIPPEILRFISENIQIPGEVIRFISENIQIPGEVIRFITENIQNPGEVVRILEIVREIPPELLRDIIHGNCIPSDMVRLIETVNQIPADLIRIIESISEMPPETFRLILNNLAIPNENMRIIEEILNIPDENIRLIEEINNIPGDTIRQLIEINRPPSENIREIEEVNQFPLEQIRQVEENNDRPNEIIRTIQQDGVIPKEQIRQVDEEVEIPIQERRVIQENINPPVESIRQLNEDIEGEIDEFMRILDEALQPMDEFDIRREPSVRNVNELIEDNVDEARDINPLPLEDVDIEQISNEMIVFGIRDYLTENYPLMQQRNVDEWRINTYLNNGIYTSMMLIIDPDFANPDNPDRVWLNFDNETRAQLFRVIGTIPQHVYAPDTVINVSVVTKNGDTKTYPIAALRDENIVLTVREYFEEYDEREDGGNAELIYPMDQINGVELEIIYRPTDGDPDLGRMQGNFFQYYIDPSCEELKELLGRLEIFVEKEWQQKENCFYKALEHWNEYCIDSGLNDRYIDDEIMRKIKFRLRGNGLTKNLLEYIGNHFDLYFDLTIIRIRHNSNGNGELYFDKNRDNKKYGAIGGKKIDLGLIVIKEQGHYFANYPSKATVAGIKHYHYLKRYSKTLYDSVGREIKARTLEERLSVVTVKTFNDQLIPIWSSNNQVPKYVDNALMLQMMVELNEKTNHRYLVEIPNYMLYRGWSFYRDRSLIRDVDIGPKRYFDGKVDPDSREIKYIANSSGDIIYVADTECVTEGRHKPYAISFALLHERGSIRTVIGSNCIRTFLVEMTGIYKDKIDTVVAKPKPKRDHANKGKKLIVYFHNLTYDGRMFCEQDIYNITMAGNRIIEMVIMPYKDVYITLRDSLMLIPCKLASFPAMFHLNEESKQLYPYSYFKNEMFNEYKIKDECRYIELGEILNSQETWHEVEKNEFKNLLLKENIIVDGKVDVDLMIRSYINSDVRILQKGMLQFQHDVSKGLNLELTSYLSISSLAYAYMKREAFDGENIYEYTGELRDFIRQAVYGGRCMTRGNNAYKVDNVEIDDIDACSLYPSAMSIMTIPKGAPKKKNDPNREWLESGLINKSINAAIVRIRITAIGRPLQFPLMCHRNKQGVILYENIIDDEIVVDDIQLMEMVKWQLIEYDLLECIYWNEGESTKIQDAIKRLYDLRAKAKKDGNTIEQVYKLIMNSSYGKCIEMSKPSRCHIVKGENYVNHLFQHYTNIQSINEILPFDKSESSLVVDEHDIRRGSKFIFREYQQYDCFFVPTMIGVRILSTSKKLMNEVMVPAELEGILIFYQDTDSMHILHSQKYQLEEAWRKHNNKHEGSSLYGNMLCQFHPDFEKIEGKDSISCGSIFLGKKMYIDKLVCKERSPETDGIVKYMTRLKGIPKKSMLQQEIRGFETSDPKKLWEIYCMLFDGYSIDFELVVDRIKFSFTKHLEVKTINTFLRAANAPKCDRWIYNENNEWEFVSANEVNYRKYFN